MADAKIKIITDEMLADYKKTCIKWNKVLGQLPLRAANDVLKYFGGKVSGLRGKQRFGNISGKSQFGPFKKNRTSAAEVEIEWREIETHEGNVVETFCPHDYIDTPLGYSDPVLTEAIKNAGSSLLVMAQMMKAWGQYIAQAAITGEHNPTGDETVDICDGIVTIARKEITAENISEAKGNLFKWEDGVTYENAADVAKQILFAMNRFLRRENNIMLCPSDFEDKYNESYMLTHTGLVYNTQYDQPYVEGSKKKLTIVGLPELDGTDMAIVTQPSNLLYGYDNIGDTSRLDIMRTGHYDLSMAADMWMGFQFHTIDPRRLMIVDLKEKTQTKPQNPPQQGS